jgi:hypothetical protein
MNSGVNRWTHRYTLNVIHLDVAFGQEFFDVSV